MRSLGFGVFACALVAGLVGCGGGGGNKSGSGSNPGGGQSTPAANVTVNVTSAAINASIAQGDPYSTTVTGNWSATNLGSGAVYLQVSDSANTFTLPAIQAAPSNGAFSYALPISATLGSGERTGTITVRACKDAACSNVHAGTSGSVGYRLTVTVTPAPDWETTQGNAAHNGYVPITLDASKFAKAWEWRPPHVPAVRNIWLGMPVTGSDGVYMNTIPYSDDFEASDELVALEENTGATRWTKSVGTSADPAYSTSVAYSSGRIYYVKGLYTFNTNNTYAGFIALQASNGSTAFSSEAVQLANAAASPTPFAGNVYTSGVLKHPTLTHASINGASGALQWSVPIVQSAQGKPWAAPSVDSQNLYFHSACCLEILDRQSGTVVASITNPSADATYTTRTLFSPTLLGTRGNVLALALTPTAGKRRLSSFGIASKSLEWTSALDYGAYPAVANGVIYASRIENNRVSLHALNEATGQPLWTWTPPEAEGQYTHTYNIVATRNLVFLSAADSVSQAGRLWAIDINSRQPVWSYPGFGLLAISAKRMLYLAANGSVGLTVEQSAKDDALIAFKLN